MFRPPWLWSILEVIKRTIHMGPVRIGSFEDEPCPIAIPSNCGQCDAKVMEIIGQYNLSHDINSFDTIKCRCQAAWEEEVNK